MEVRLWDPPAAPAHAVREIAGGRCPIARCAGQITGVSSRVAFLGNVEASRGGLLALACGAPADLAVGVMLVGS